MVLTIRVKNCCLAANATPRYEAKVGDELLIRDGTKIFEATIVSVPSPNDVEVIVENGVRKTMPIVSILTLMLSD